jgi:hypothetical protein
VRFTLSEAKGCRFNAIIKKQKSLSGSPVYPELMKGSRHQKIPVRQLRETANGDQSAKSKHAYVHNRNLERSSQSAIRMPPESCSV